MKQEITFTEALALIKSIDTVLQKDIFREGMAANGFVRLLHCLKTTIF